MSSDLECELQLKDAVVTVVKIVYESNQDARTDLVDVL